LLLQRQQDFEGVRPVSFSVNTNANALSALYTLSLTQRSLAETQQHINSGYKIGSAKDNASTFSIAEGMRGDISALQAVGDSLNQGQSAVNVAASAAQSISDQVKLLIQKVQQAQDPTNNTQAIQDQIDSIVESIDSFAKAAQFNGVNLLNGAGPGLSVVSSLNRTSASTVAVVTTNVAEQNLTSLGLGISGLSVIGGSASQITQAAGLSFAIGDTITLATQNAAGNNINYVFEITDGTSALSTPTTTTTAPNAPAGTVAIPVVSDTSTDTPQQTLGKIYAAMRANGFAVTANDDGSFYVNAANGLTATPVITGTAAGNLTASTPVTGATAATSLVQQAMNRVTTALGALGTAQNELQAQGDFIVSLVNSLTTGVGNLVDADLAAESATLQALQTKQQLGIQALSIANQSASAVLALFKS
jgi:flagellin